MKGEHEQPMEPGQATVVAGLAALGCAAFVLVAISAEVIAGLYANSTVPSWAERVAPLGWPQPVRVAWWLAVASAAGAFRFFLHRLGLRQRPWVVAVSVLPFVIFAGGIAAGAWWATWH